MATADTLLPPISNPVTQSRFSTLYTKPSVVDPVEFGKDQGIVGISQTQQQYEERLKKKAISDKQCKKIENGKWYHTLAAQSVIALISAGLIPLFCYIINPPVTQKKAVDQFTSEKQDWKKVFALTLFVFLIVLLLPEVIRLVNLLIYKKKQGKK